MRELQMGDQVFATQDLFNDALETGESAIPHLAPDVLLARKGTRGVIVNVGHAEADPKQIIYLVRFESAQDSTLTEPIGCLSEEVRA
jgi:nitrogen fixation protein NifZ